MSIKKRGAMFCDGGQKEWEEKDFIEGRMRCYKCVYKEKLEIIKNRPKVRRRKTQYCRKCGNEIAFDEQLKKRQRNIYCSPECAKLGHQEQNGNFWTTKLRKTFPGDKGRLPDPRSFPRV